MPMCGIIGYVGRRAALPILLEGLKRLEYRGYDSAGVCVVDDGLKTVRSPGKIKVLEEKLAGHGLAGTVGIAHTRWATHGSPVERNTHPHADCRGRLALVHNGIIENYAELRRELEAKGHGFASDTDTETLAHLIEQLLTDGAVDLPSAVRAALKRVRGTYGLAVVSQDHPDVMIVARLGSPIVLGIGDDELFVASDASAILGHTRRVIFLDDGEMAILNRDGYQVCSLDNAPVQKTPEEVDWSAEQAQKNGQPHFMLKEMLEQPDVVRNSLRGRLDISEGLAVLGGLRDVADRLRQIDRLIIVACGSAYYSGLVGEYMIEGNAGVPVEVELGSEFRYRKPIITPQTAVLAVSQSGETADTLAALREAKMKGALTLGIVNSVGSTIARETEAGVYNHAGPEVGVASTKAFVSQLTVLALLTLFLGRQRQMSVTYGNKITQELFRLPEMIQTILDQRANIELLAKRWAGAKDMLYLGRNYLAPIAFEGALKLKEVSYIHAEGYAAGEMKHGPIALIDPGFPCLVLCPEDGLYEKTKSNIQEIKARGGPIIALTTEGNAEVSQFADDVLFMPKTIEMLQPILSVVPLQLFAYYIAVAKGFDPDKPRNLAKSVTVE
jgi:glucosamine--fructose-6-phosphate aminotransferase (isomerizing)